MMNIFSLDVYYTNIRVHDIIYDNRLLQQQYRFNQISRYWDLLNYLFINNIPNPIYSSNIIFWVLVESRQRRYSKNKNKMHRELYSYIANDNHCTKIKIDHKVVEFDNGTCC